MICPVLHLSLNEHESTACLVLRCLMNKLGSDAQRVLQQHVLSEVVVAPNLIEYISNSIQSIQVKDLTDAV